ncbi:MAG: hypothetical protein ACLQBD_20985 [Syntrophobacteraceae bacterium]
MEGLLFEGEKTPRAKAKGTLADFSPESAGKIGIMDEFTLISRF